ncbi:MAG: glycosyltransferase family 4 protein [Rikenellaceae bacterium]
MKIIYCVPQLYRPGGIERIVSIKANSLVEDYNCEVVIITSDQKGLPTYYPLSERIKVYDLGIDYDSMLQMPLQKRILKKLQLSGLHKKKLTSLLESLNADITISTFTHEASFLPKIKDGSKKVLEFHFCRGHKKMMSDAFNFSLPTKLAYYFKCWQEENIIIPRFDQFVVLTEEDKERWKSKIKNVICISNISPFDGANETAKLVNKQAIAVGRLDAQKGFDRLISIWADIHTHNTDWILNIYGAGKHEDRLRSQIKELNLEDVVIINSPDKDIKQRYLESSLFLMTSSYEGLPMTLLEAQSLGLPAIAYDFKCGPKDVIKNGDSGYIIKDGNHTEFVSKVLSVIDNEELRIKMGKNAASLSSRYNRSTIMEKWMTLFNSLSK